MPLTYGVTIGDVSAEIPALAANGFSDTSKPTAQKVASWIAAADAMATLAVFQTAAVTPQVSDRAAPIARQFIIAYALAWVMRALYAGNDPKAVALAAQDYQASADALLVQLQQLGVQAAGSGTAAASLIRGSDASLSRDLLVQDQDLGGLATGYPTTLRARRF